MLPDAVQKEMCNIIKSVAIFLFWLGVGLGVCPKRLPQIAVLSVLGVVARASASRSRSISICNPANVYCVYIREDGDSQMVALLNFSMSALGVWYGFGWCRRILTGPGYIFLNNGWLKIRAANNVQ